MTEKTKSIIGIMLIIISLSSAFLYWGISMYQKNMGTKIIETTDRTSLLIDHVIQNTSTIYQIRIETILKDEKLLSAFNERDRKKLFELALPWHMALKTESTFYSNMHFHLPNGHSFLRMHKPGEFGDDLRELRPIIMDVHKTRARKNAYEIGKHGLFFRVANPIFYNHQYIGTLEIGIRVDETHENLENVLGVRVARFIASQDLNPDFRKFRHQKEIQAQGRFINAYDHVDFFKKAVAFYDFKDPVPQRGIIDENHFVFFQSGELKNFKDRTIAKFLVAQDISKEISDYNSFLKNSIILTLFLIMSAYIVLNFSFGVMVEKIVELNRTLEARVRKRTKSLEDLNKDVLHANAELNQVINTAADGMRIIDTNYNVLRVNDTFLKLMGKSKFELENRPCHEWLKGELCFTSDCTLRRILDGEKRVEMDVERMVEGGEKKSFLLTATPFTSPGGEILGVVENFKDITDRKKYTQALKEKEEYLNGIMATVQTGVIVTSLEEPLIFNANPYAAKLIGCSVKELINSRQDIYFELKKPWITQALKPGSNLKIEDCLLKTTIGKTLIVRLAIAPVTIRGETYLVQSFSDISDMKRLIEKQAVDINKAKSIMTLVNEDLPRCFQIRKDCRIFASAISVPCNAEGGDHFFLRHFPKNSSKIGKSFISLKDQSGHEVNCILRSLYTDLIHNAALHHHKITDTGQVITHLNNELCNAPVFEDDDFFTSINAQINHETLMLSYVCSGHPPFLLIRNNEVSAYPPSDTDSHLPIPFIADTEYTTSAIQLQQGDQLLFYTDGLVEMSLKKTGRTLNTHDLINIAQTIINDHFNRYNQTLPVSELMQSILDNICKLSDETVVESSGKKPSINTSPDDITMLALELESNKNSHEQTFFFDTTHEISTQIPKLHTAIFKQEDAKPFAHLKKQTMTVLEESVLNAWNHGNKKDPKKSITVRWQFQNDFTLEIVDQGNGFDYHHMPDPTQKENILKSGGRGLFIIHITADHVQFRKNGSHIIISFEKKQCSEINKTNYLNRIKLWQV